MSQYVFAVPWLIFSFYAPRKHQNTSGFSDISTGDKKNIFTKFVDNQRPFQCQ